MYIIECEDRVDLRTINSKSMFLKHIEKQYALKNNQAICFTNKLMTRFRLVMKIRNMMFMCIPEVDDKSKYSVYLKISETLAKLAGVKPRIQLNLYAAETQERIERQRKRAKKSKAKYSKRSIK